MIKAIFFDIDGTLISFCTHTMPESARKALNALREKGIRLFISTGRAPSSIGFVKEMFDFDGYVTMNGQYCFSKDQLIYEHGFAKEDVAALVEQSKTAPYTYCFVEPNDMYIDKLTDSYQNICKLVNLSIPSICNSGYPLNRKIYQMIVSVTKEEEHIITDAAPGLEVTRWHPSFVDVIPKGGGKDIGIAAMLEHFHIKREEIMAFGDGDNDISMLQYAGIGVAMGNAAATVQAKADYTTSSVDDNGIYHALLHYSVIEPIADI